MKKFSAGFLFTFLISFLISCQKELTMDSSLGGGMPSVEGNWKFVEMRSMTQSIVEISDGVDVLKTITTSDFTTTNNTGALTVDANRIVSTGLGYEVAALAIGYIFENNILVDSAKVPFTYVAPPTNSAAGYTRVSADSITFGPGFMSVAGTTAATDPTGAKMQIQGDKLTLTVKAARSDVQSVFGITQTQKESATAVMTYQKQ